MIENIDNLRAEVEAFVASPEMDRVLVKLFGLGLPRRTA